MTTRQATRTMARSRNKNLGKAYDLLRKWGVGFYNDKLAVTWDGPATGRSLKPLVPLTAYQHRAISRLADRVRVTSPYRDLRGSLNPGGERRYHFLFAR